MVEIELMRCTSPYWYAKSGVDTLMAAGTVLPKGHPDILDGTEWEPLQIENVTAVTTRTSRRKG